MENNKQTAVNYLLSHIWTTDWVNYTREQKLAIIEQAKEMEKEQIILSIAKNLPIEDGVLTAVQKAELYYEQNYGGGEQ